MKYLKYSHKVGAGEPVTGSTKMYVAYFRYSLDICFENRVKLEVKKEQIEKKEKKRRNKQSICG
jgi:hypothetical protein